MPPQPRAADPFPPPPRWMVAALALAVLLTFGRLAGHDFTTWDDPVTVYNNPRMNPPTPAGAAWYWAHAEYGLYVPVTYAAWSALAAAARLGEPDELGISLNPYVFHGANVLLHAASALTAFALLRRLLAARSPIADPSARRRIDRAALAGAMLFALHPIQVEAVGWVSGTKDLLAGGFGLAALYGYVRAAQSIDARERSTAYAAATVALLAALLSKPSAVTVPLLAAALDRLALGRPWPAVARSAGPWLLPTAVVAVVAKLAQPAEWVEGAPPWARPLIVGDALAFYVGKVLWPATLTIDYGRTPAAVMGRPWFYAAWLVPAAIGVGLFLMRRRAPTLAAAGAAFALAPLPVLGLSTFLFQHISTVADHYLYVALLGPALALAWALSRWPSRVAFAAAGLALAALAARSVGQARVWRDDGTLFSHAVAVRPSSWVGWTNLGVHHDVRRDREAAARMYRRAIREGSEHLYAHNNLALVLATLKRPDEAERQFADALRRRGEAHPARRYDLANEYAQFGQRLLDSGFPGRAVPYLRRALRLRPGDPAIVRLVRVADEEAAAPATTAPAPPATAPAATRPRT